MLYHWVWSTGRITVTGKNHKYLEVILSKCQFVHQKIPNLLAWDRTRSSVVKGDADDTHNSEEENSKPAIFCVKISVVIIIKHGTTAILCVHFINFLPRTHYVRQSCNQKFCNVVALRNWRHARCTNTWRIVICKPFGGRIGLETHRDIKVNKEAGVRLCNSPNCWSSSIQSCHHTVNNSVT